MIKSRFRVLILGLWLISLSSVALGAYEELDIKAQAYVLIDPISGRVLAQKSADEKLPMASTTKIMTAILALEKGDLKSRVKTSPKAASIGGSSFNLRNGEEMSLENMLYGLLLPSGNDAAVAIAEHVAGDEKSFVNMMNQKALELGAINTHFQNPHGLDAPGHYTTAIDLAIISRYAWNIPKFREIVCTPSITIKDGISPRQLYNTNRLLTSFEGANGIKTGYTGKAGRCLAASAIRDEMHLISVVLGTEDHFSTSGKLLSYGFSNYKPQKIIDPGTSFPTLPVVRGVKDSLTLEVKAEISMPLKDGEKVELNYILPKNIPAPIQKGQQVGEVEIYVDDQRALSAQLVAALDIPKKTYRDYLRQIILEWYSR